MPDFERENMIKASRVNEYLSLIEETDFSDITSDHGKKSMGSRLGKIILDDLPEQVGTYTHSEELPFITSTRYEGDTWDSSKTREWVYGILSQYGSKFKLG